MIANLELSPKVKLFTFYYNVSIVNMCSDTCAGSYLQENEDILNSDIQYLTTADQRLNRLDLIYFPHLSDRTSKGKQSSELGVNK